MKGEGLERDATARHLAQFQIRNQIAVVKGAEIPGVFGGKYRQAMIYVDPYKLLSRQLSVMDVVNAVNQQQPDSARGRRQDRAERLLRLFEQPGEEHQRSGQFPIKTVGTQLGHGRRCGEAKDASQLQYNIVRIDGQKSAYIPDHEIRAATPTPSRWSTTFAS